MENRQALLWLFGATLSACSATPREPTPPATSAATPTTVATAAPSAPPRTSELACSPDARTIKSGHRATGLERVAARKYQQALSELELALDEKPSDLGAFSLHAIAEAEVAAARADASKLYLRLKPSKVEPVAPPRKLLIKADKAQAVTLKQIKEASYGGDWLAWAEGAGIKSALGFGSSDETAGAFPDSFGELGLVGSYFDGEAMVARYGQATIVVRHETLGLRAVDLDKQVVEAFRSSVAGGVPDSIFPEVRFAAVVGSTLVVELAHEGDGANVKSDGALLAYDLELDKVRWVSDLRVSNTYTFFTTGSHVVVAFEDDKTTSLAAVDVATGEVVAKQSLPFAADHIVGKGKAFHVSGGGDKVVTFELSQAPERPQPKLGQTLALLPAAQPTVIVPMACFLGNALVALDQRDGKSLMAIASQLPDTSSAGKVLKAAAEFLSARAEGTAGLDLTEAQPTPVAYVEGPLVMKGAKLAAVTKRAVTAKDPTVQPPKAPFPEGPRQLYAAKRYDIYPQRYGVGGIHGAYAWGNELGLLYGNRYVVVVVGDEVKRVYDLAPLLGPGGKGGKTATSFSTVIEGVLYAVVSPTAGYGSGGSSAYVAAVDLKTGKVLWRTAPGVVTSPFSIFGDALVTATTKNGRSSLVLHRLGDGQLLQTTPLTDVASSLGWDSRGVLYVGAANNKKQFFQVK